MGVYSQTQSWLHFGRFTARLVAKGYSQTQGHDYNDTFFPVAKMNSVRNLHSLAGHFDWPLHHQLDVTNTFLHGYLQKEVYMQQPLDLWLRGSLKRCANYRNPFIVLNNPLKHGLKNSAHNIGLWFYQVCGRLFGVCKEDLEGVCSLDCVC